MTLTFELGRVLATPWALRTLAEAGESIDGLLFRHRHGDWGEVSADDWQENELSVGRALRILSAYTLTTGTRIWIITEADRSATTVLLPEEY